MKENYSNRIEEVMTSAMKNLKSLVDVDIVVGNTIFADGLSIVPLTKVTLGFVSGGGEYYSELKEIKKGAEYPFTGGSGGGLSLQPIGFLVIKNKQVELIKIDSKSAVEKLIEAVPEVAKFFSKNFGKKENDK